MAEKQTGNTKAHTSYKLADGSRVPSVTTILGILNKPALVKWANNLGLQGIDSSKFVDEKARIGSLTHSMIEFYIRTILTQENQTCDTGDYTKNQIDMAQASFEKFMDWWSRQDIVPIMSEAHLVSEDYGYGGTIDLYCKLNGEYTLVDFKTSKAVYPEHIHQLSAYETLLAENGYPVDRSIILRVGRDDSEGFEQIDTGELVLHFTLFHHCLEIYRLQAKIRKGG